MEKLWQGKTKRIIINGDMTEAVIERQGMDPLVLNHSEGKVLELVLWYVLPSLPKNVDVGQIAQAWVNSMEETNPLAKVA
jgi:hypothetical protein